MADRTDRRSYVLDVSLAAVGRLLSRAAISASMLASATYHREQKQKLRHLLEMCLLRCKKEVPRKHRIGGTVTAPSSCGNFCFDVEAKAPIKINWTTLHFTEASGLFRTAIG